MTINTIGSENGIIINDQEINLGARITLEKDGRTAPFSITCGIYGLFFHTAFFGDLVEANNKYEEMKNEIQTFLLNESYNEDQISKWCSSFSSKY